MQMTSADLDTVFAQLAAMPTFLEEAFGALSEQDAIWRGSRETFAPVEQCWHLADLERDGFAMRIRRLVSETAPVLPDFDGARVAEEGQYLRRSLAEGLKAFQAARLETMEQLRGIAPHEWSRTGTQQGVGVVVLRDMPRMMAGHDAGHRQEIEDWLHRHRARNEAACRPMKVREPDFDVEITLSDLEAIRDAIRKWGKPRAWRTNTRGARLYDQLLRLGGARRHRLGRLGSVRVQPRHRLSALDPARDRIRERCHSDAPRGGGRAD